MITIHKGSITDLTNECERLRKVLSAYHALHDVVSDTIEGGRLTEADCPDDYQAIVHHLSVCSALDDTHG